jgi:uncharacterized protein (TIGR03437 family)
VDLYSQVTGEVRTVPVTITVSRTTANLLVTPAGLTFRATVGSTSTQTQRVNIVNTGSGAMNWTAAIRNAPWLTASAAQGSGSTALTLTANPSGLPVGEYYGQVEVRAPDAANAQQTVSVVLQIATAETALRPVIEPAGLVFTGVPGGAALATQTITLTNPTRTAISFTATADFTGSRTWFSVSPASGSVAAGQTATIEVRPATSGIAAGVYSGAIDLRFGGETTRVGAVLVLNAAAAAGRAAERAADCTPTRMQAVFVAPEGGFQSAVGWPLPLRVRLVNDCGAGVDQGQVTVSFANGDPSVSLTPLGNGAWSGTWTVRNASKDRVTLTARASVPGTRLVASAQTGGTLDAPNANPPVVARGGLLNAASFQVGAPVAPGTLVSVFGTRLAERLTSAGALPLPNEMQGTAVFLGGRALPLVFVSEAQINAQVPYDLEPNTEQLLVVRRGNALSVPEPVAIAAASPAIFAIDGTGKGQAHVYRFGRDGSSGLANAANPVVSGDVLVIYATGFGATNPGVAAGAAAPEPAARSANPIIVTVGASEAPILFAGLTPGLVGLYQLNIQAPDRLPPGQEIPIQINVAGQKSPTLSFAVGR